jgi:DNA-binding MarR family transcriptional regulator
MSPQSDEFTQVLRNWAEVFMHRSFRDFKHFMDESGISGSQFNVLMRLYHGGKCGVSHIGEHLGISRAASSQLVDRLVVQGLLERAEDPHDRRGKQITLTAQGRSLIEAGIEARAVWMKELTTSLTQQEQEEIIRSLTVLTEAARRLEKNKEGNL